MRRRRFLAIAATVAVGAACAPALDATTQPARGPLAADPANGVWPAFIRSAPIEIREAYAFATAHPAQLAYIPCYCGCGGSGHRSNADCFVAKRMPDGWVILEPHGSQCGTCVGIALDSKTLLAKGLSLADVRATIDKRWSAAGPGTMTPLP